MASRQSKNRHFSIPAEAQSKAQYECEQKVWTSDIHDERRRRASSQRRYIDVVATPIELQGLLPPQTDELGSEDYRPERERLRLKSTQRTGSNKRNRKYYVDEVVGGLQGLSIERKQRLRWIVEVVD